MPRKRSKLPWLGEINGIFYVFQYNPATRRTDRKSLKTDEEEIARGIFAEYITGARTLNGERVNRDVGLKIDVALDDYFREHAGKKAIANEIEQCINVLKQHFKGLVKDIDDSMCQAYVYRRGIGEIGHRRMDRGPILKAGVGRSRLEISYLIAAVNHARKKKRLSLVDVPPIEMPQKPGPRSRHLTYDELKKLRETADQWSDRSVAYERVKWFIEIAYYTASRRNAIEKLHWDQVSFDLNRIYLAKQGELKTKKRRPVVPIHPELLPTLQECWSRKRSEAVLGSKRDLSTDFRAVADAAGLPDVTPHTLRHTRATHLLWQGVDIWTVAKLLGDTVKTVEDVYGHNCPDFMEQAMQRTEG